METSANTNTHETEPENRDEVLLSRKQLCRRWDCSSMTIYRREAAGLLHPLRFNSRMMRYRLSEILAIEQGAQGWRSGGEALNLNPNLNLNPSGSGEIKITSKSKNAGAEASTAAQPSTEA